MSYTKVLIIDLQEKQSIDLSDSYQYKINKLNYLQECKSLESQPRDETVWSKTKQEKELLKRCKTRWKAEMLSDFPNFTNKSDLHNTKALLWS